MISIRVFLLVAMIFVGAQAQQELSAASVKRSLLVYDSIDSKSEFYIKTIQKQLSKAGIVFDEVAVAHGTIKNFEVYESIMIYSRVMGFNLISPVKKWLNTEKSLANKKVFIFVTANRWFEKNNLAEISKLVTSRGGTIVDAVSSATDKMTVDQKVKSVETQVLKIQKSVQNKK